MVTFGLQALKAHMYIQNATGVFFETNLQSILQHKVSKTLNFGLWQHWPFVLSEIC